jgi:hypothetical protein
MARPIITAERLRELLNYDPSTGLFTWLVSRGPAKIGGIAGCMDGEWYIVIGVDVRQYRAHRLAWLYMTGEWPIYEIDHKNTIQYDNRFDNLRQATRSQNKQNMRRAMSCNRCGLLGVSDSNGRCHVQICVAVKRRSLGYYDTPELAHAAYLAAKAILHPFQTIVETK